jgi:thymidylate synthase
MIYSYEQKNSYAECFIDSLRDLKYNGRISYPRGQKTLELDHVVFQINPLRSLYFSKARKLNLFFLIAENLWYWSGRNTTFLPTNYVKNYSNFSDDGIHQGSYSPQLLEQIRYVINTLQKDNDSRQAVITLWRPNPGESKDIPCTISFDFKIRNCRLNMHATMRSNDAIWGNNYDVPSFCLLQIAIAGILGIRPGFLYLAAHSYHVYEKHFELMSELIKEPISELNDQDMILNNNCKGLEDHLCNIEDLLSVHYKCAYGVDASNICFEHFAPFYRQFALMIALFHDNKNANIYIKELEKINSPFSKITL